MILSTSTYTSLLEVYVASCNDSIAIHFTGSFPFSKDKTSHIA